ncbi:MAG: tRNA (adenosine(37)-N6)-threonylcarbamoyltransferase complex ATPase subunit type 1 TsaE [Bacteroidaceae bacterium]|nr:tRNA (adenosine(37)-N6)-threonylcarbamoyltransferase complex ATPase subunit type 1 TsaE [Bacteroidaceae bacterium]
MRRWIAEKIQVLNKQIKIENIDNIASAARKFIDEMGENCVFAFYGKMGAGKTTFIKAICEALGVTDPVASPTFAIVNEYADAQGQPIYHFDFYRIKNLREAYDIGCEEYFYSGFPCFIEWPEMVEELLPEDAVKVTIEVLEDEARVVTLS